VPRVTHISILSGEEKTDSASPRKVFIFIYKQTDGKKLLVLRFMAYRMLFYRWPIELDLKQEAG